MIKRDYVPMTANPKRLKRGMDKLREGFRSDYQASLTYVSRLPKNWRNRIIR